VCRLGAGSTSAQLRYLTGTIDEATAGGMKIVAEMLGTLLAAGKMQFSGHVELT